MRIDEEVSYDILIGTEYYPNECSSFYGQIVRIHRPALEQLFIDIGKDGGATISIHINDHGQVQVSLLDDDFATEDSMAKNSPPTFALNREGKWKPAPR